MGALLDFVVVPNEFKAPYSGKLLIQHKYEIAVFAFINLPRMPSGLSHLMQKRDRSIGHKMLHKLERAKGIEPSYAAWEAAVLPLNYARLIHVP